MKNLNLWRRLSDMDLVSGEQPANEQVHETTFWYIRVLQGFAGWLAAVFLIGFLGFGVAGLFEHGAAMMVLGVILNVSSYVFFKTKPGSDFFEQMVLAFSLTGQFLFAFGLFELFEFKGQQWLAVVGLYQIVLMLVMPNFLHRFLSAWFAVIALFWGFEAWVYSGLGSALVAALFVWLWLDKTGWQADKDLYEPIGYALGLSLLQLNVQSQYWLFDMFRYRQYEGSWLMQNAEWISALLNSAVLLYFIFRMAQEHKVALSSKAGRFIVLAAVVMMFSALPVIGLSSAILVILVGFARQNKVLLVMGVISLLGFVSWYYYSLNITLLQKSLILMLIGTVLLLGHVLLKVMFASDNKAKVDDSQLNHQPQILSIWQKGAVVVTLLVGLIGVNHAIWQKERVLGEGQSVFLELAPVDPRSLMQGDYMRLRFAIADQISNHLKTVDLPDRGDSHDGFIYVSLDDNRVAQFHSLEAADITAESPMIMMQYRMRNNRIQFATNAFFFQEGDAKKFQAAKYGEFKVADDGELLLKAMYDKDLKLLGENRLD
ncbi:GDYXXLXY domain-containing protein [Marinicella litoralis]|uniref:Putative membrane-anchored protein n=1 Tax=Marinicella litoralis TaxID=644220 RepID=A0A4R6XM47_9GAMM|nr:GDYXXLXY domain-containing protein [Marinicella litoralis]TDR19429.1 putative membrane-anchored protein [Marinicella litoralis]